MKRVIQIPFKTVTEQLQKQHFFSFYLQLLQLHQITNMSFWRYLNESLGCWGGASQHPLTNTLFVSALWPDKHVSHTLLMHHFPFFSSFLFLLTSVLMASGLFPSLPRKCSGDNMVPSWRKSASLSWSVSVVAEMPASGPRLGREPAASEGSGICPGIMSDPATTAAVKGERA